MDRISTTNKAVDLFGAGRHGFKDGDLALGIAPTELNAAWFNAVQEELMAIIEAAGIVPSAGTRNQVLTALRSAGVHQTPAQFDNSTQAATSAFVQRALGNYRGFYSTASALTLTAAHVGGFMLTSGSTNYTITLPAANSIGGGGAITFTNGGTGVVSVARAGTDVININAGTATAISLQPGDTLTIVTNGSNAWAVSGGSANLLNSAAFGSSLAANGYQKLPSGLIIQWFKTNASGSVVFPIAFPTGVLSVVGTAFDVSASYAEICAYKALTNSGFTAIVQNGTGGQLTQEACWIVLGY